MWLLASTNGNSKYSENYPIWTNSLNKGSYPVGVTTLEYSLTKDLIKEK
jgi:hypothetical protein